MKEKYKDIKFITGQGGIRAVNLMPEEFAGKFKFLISTRQGGVSRHPYDTLNMSFNAGDRKEDAAFNRKRFFDLSGLRESDVSRPEQIHGENIAVVKKGGKTDFPGTDALITKEKGVVLSIMTADCLPIMIFDPVNEAVGAIHAGWRGSLLLLAKKTIEKMAVNFNTRAPECRAVLGPCICAGCYEIRSDIVNECKKVFKGREIGVIRKNGRIYFDIREINTLILIHSGLKRKNIYSAELCTSCMPELFFSHRRDYGMTGRMMSLMWME